MTSNSSSNRKEEDRKRIERLAMGSMENASWKVGFDYRKWTPSAEFSEWRFIKRLRFEQRFNEFCRMVWEICQNYHGIEKVAEKYRICEDQDYAHRHRAAAYFIALHFYPPYYCYKNGVFSVTKLKPYVHDGPPPVLPEELRPMRPDLPFNWPFDSEEVLVNQADVDPHLDHNNPFTIGSAECIPGYQPKPAAILDPLAGLELLDEPEPELEPETEPVEAVEPEPEPDIVLDVPAVADPVAEPAPEPDPEDELDEDDFDIDDSSQMDMAAAIDWAWLHLGRKNLKRKDCPNGGAWYVWKLADTAPAKFFEIANRLHERREKEQVEITKRQADDRRRSFEFLNIVKSSLSESIESRVDELLSDPTRDAFLAALKSRGFTAMRIGGAT